MNSYNNGGGGNGGGYGGGYSGASTKPSINTPYLSEDAKKKLLFGDDNGERAGGARRWGGAKESEYTSQLNNQQLMDKQNDVMQGWY
ncbi:hypothetical protein SAMD00019534_051380 [Acytostelium subglobosum LB1]|uniref:hypothetical protein n=1 Tax=Acytostelium subglobosum LB1 TaxID=1410327 RepID=UPI000644FF3C|nr:hypothetical protein SAMD00019534_051380 [Acytostelium subglobosum LB1]GAM21963.1 hypothetical protein SAMD00019534_051380 [Acytostelium subglobosum LB1]|eukprot:XP_012755063.1 hypothetical protein SAMD00019534_051380 [Acytostelium subglobosum LB1]